jgi:hypothetical protein
MWIGRDFRPRIWLNRIVMTPYDSVPEDLAAAHAMILAQRAVLAQAGRKSRAPNKTTAWGVVFGNS